jgi:hypothetical protein
VADKYVQFYDLARDPRQRADLTRRVDSGSPSPSSRTRIRRGTRVLQVHKRSVYVVPRTIEGVYIRMLLSMKTVYSEWTVERDNGYLSASIDTLLVNQLQGRELNDQSYTQHLDSKELKEVNAIVFKTILNDKKNTKVVATASKGKVSKEGRTRRKKLQKQKLRNNQRSQHSF